MYRLNYVCDASYSCTIINKQVTVKYRWNASSLSIDMSADNQTTTLVNILTNILVDISIDARPKYRSLCRPTHLISQNIDRHSTNVGRHIGWDSANMSANISVECRSRGAQNTRFASCLQDGRQYIWKENMLNKCSKQDFIPITLLVIVLTDTQGSQKFIPNFSFTY